MSYIRKSYSGAPIGIGVVVAFFLLARCVGAVGNLAPARAPASTEQALLENAEAGEIYRVMKRTYPQEFAALVTRIDRMSAQRKSEKEMRESVTTFMIEAEGRVQPALRQAGHAALAKYRTAEIGLIEALQATDPRLCAQYIIEGTLRMPYQLARTKAAIAKLHVATFEGAADGRDHPANRKIAQPSQSDWALIDKAMIAAGVPKPVIQQFFDPASARQMAPALQCSTGLHFRRAIEGLPLERVDAFYVALINTV